jgi:peroxiredoxin
VTGRFRLLVAVLILLCGCAGFRPEGAVVPLATPRPPGDGTVEVGKPYFDFTAPTLGGGKLSLSEILGQKAVLLQFWSISCKPCLEEIQLLSRLQAEYGRLGLQVIGVNIDNGGPARLRETLRTRGIVLPYPVALDPTRTASARYAPWAVPVTVLIDRTGMVRAVHTGYKPAVAARIEGEVGALLGR